MKRARPDLPYYTGEVKGDVQLIPAEAKPYVDGGQLDLSLFNLSRLAADGYAQKPLPLMLVESSDRPGIKAPSTPVNAIHRRTLESIASNAVTPKAGKERAFWESIDDNTPGDGRVRLANGLDKVVLDAKVHTTSFSPSNAGALARFGSTTTSTTTGATTGAATQQAIGYDGRGVKVAVLDTGYDQGHPDLADRVSLSKSFVPGETVQDGFGHGTHVASILGGSGAASGGKRKGVAPKANLIIGKVLDDSGSGDQSWAIDGMEWAVEQGAKVVNMSFGAFAIGPDDMMTRAVDRLSSKSGTLFVTTAGNNAKSGLNSPGTAASALTVGAIDDDGAIANFSSRGPRAWDGVVKPEVTAPGVDIVAAKAAGTDIPTSHDLDRWYTSLSGTSMSAPYVAGAVALVAQAHPDWTPTQLKSAMVTTAKPTSTVSPALQGLGAIDIPAAVGQQVQASASSLVFGELKHDSAPLTRQVRYRNNTKRSVTLDLKADVETLGAGDAGPAITVTPQRLKLEPGTSAKVTVRLDPSATEPAVYSGALVASLRGTTAEYRTAIGLKVAGRTHELTVSALDRKGKPATAGFSGAQIMNLATGDIEEVAFDRTGATKFTVPSGHYSVMVFAFTEEGLSAGQSVALLGDPDVAVRSSMALRFDARNARQVKIKLPKRADRDDFILAWHRKVKEQTGLQGWNLVAPETQQVYVQPFTPAEEGEFRWVYRAPFDQPVLSMKIGDRYLTSPRKTDLEVPSYVGDGRLRIVNGGTGKPAELTGAEGAVALVKWTSDSNGQAQAKAAKDAGVKLVLFYRDQATSWFGGPSKAPLPVYRIQRDEALELLTWLAKGPIEAHVNGVSDSTYRYELVFDGPGGRGDLNYDLSRSPMASVTTKYNKHTGRHPDHAVTRQVFVPGIDLAFPRTRNVQTPFVRTDYLMVGRDLEWSELGYADPWNWTSREWSVPRTYRPGQRVIQDWFPALIRPAIPDIAGGDADGLPVARFQDVIRVGIPQYVSGDRDIYSWGDDKFDATGLTLRKDGKVQGQAKWSVAQFLVQQNEARYELELNVTRKPGVWATTSTKTHTVWGFKSKHVDGRVVLPLLQADYRLETDLYNRLTSNRVEITPGYQPGARGPGGIEVGAQVSFDDGKTWQPARSRHGMVTVPDAPAGATEGSIKVTLTDRGGNRMEQTIIRAWHLK